MFEMHKAIQTNGAVVTFTKKNGKTRVMKCTTNADIYRELGVAVPDEFRPVPSLLHVVDMEIREWRSVPVDRVISWSAL